MSERFNKRSVILLACLMLIFIVINLLAFSSIEYFEHMDKSDKMCIKQMILTTTPYNVGDVDASINRNTPIITRIEQECGIRFPDAKTKKE